MENQTVSDLALSIFNGRNMGDEQTRIKEKAMYMAAELFDVFHNAQDANGSDSSNRMYALAKTNLEQSLMWFTKALSR